MGDYESTRQRHVAHMTARLPEYLERLTWSADRLRVERTLRLRELLRTARAHSSWHRSRLATVDLDAIDEDRLRELPTHDEGRRDGELRSDRHRSAQIQGRLDDVFTY